MLNLVLLGLNLDKHGALPFSTGLFAEDGAAVEETAGDAVDPDTTSTTLGEMEATTETSVETMVDSEVASQDDWPGGRGPAPNGPPVPRIATVAPGRLLTLTGSVPDWATAERISQVAGANLPDGIDGVDNQLSWHPDASADIRSGDVLIGQAATFALGQAAINPESYPTLDLAAALLKSRPSLFVVVIGHTDDVGDEHVNAHLAFDRANAVVEYLVDHGVVPGQIVVASAGEDDPTASNETQAGRDANRRIELHFKNFFIPPQDFGQTAQ